MNLYEGVIQSHINDDKMYMDACIRKDIWHDGYGSVIFATMHMRKLSGIVANQVKKCQTGPYYKRCMERNTRGMEKKN